MATYYAYLCKKCNKYFMSTSLKHSKCTYCGATVNLRQFESDKPREISEKVAKLNGINQGLKWDTYGKTN